MIKNITDSVVDEKKPDKQQCDVYDVSFKDRLLFWFDRFESHS
jgi:hypothetical protein